MLAGKGIFDSPAVLKVAPTISVKRIAATRHVGCIMKAKVK